jgi:hypothetical protein
MRPFSVQFVGLHVGRSEARVGRKFSSLILDISGDPNGIGRQISIRSSLRYLKKCHCRLTCVKTNV